MRKMASGKDDIFARVEAVLSKDWVEHSSKNVCKVLEEIEDVGVEGIRFHGGNHIVVGNLDQLVRVRDHFMKKETFSEKESKKRYDGDKLQGERANDTPRDYVQQKVKNSAQYGKPGKTTLYNAHHAEVETIKRPHDETKYEQTHGIAVGNEQTSKELMVDNDIWDYIESKRNENLQELELTFDAKITKVEDDSGILKISVNPNADETTPDMVVLMHESLANIYEAMLLQCVIEKHECLFKTNEEEQLVMEYMSQRFPDVFIKRCEYNDEFVFIGPPDAAREARKHFQVLTLRIHGGFLKTKKPKLEENYDYHGAVAMNEEFTNDFDSYDERERRSGWQRYGEQHYDKLENWNKDKEEAGRRKREEKFERHSDDTDEIDWKGANENDVKSERPAGVATSSSQFKNEDEAQFADGEHSRSVVESDGKNVDVAEKKLKTAAGHSNSTDKDFEKDVAGKTMASLKEESRLEFKEDDTIKTCSEKATKSLEDISESGLLRKRHDDEKGRGQAQHSAKIDAGSICYGSLDPRINESKEEDIPNTNPKKKKVPTATLR